MFSSLQLFGTETVLLRLVRRPSSFNESLIDIPACVRPLALNPKAGIVRLGGGLPLQDRRCAV